MPNPEGMLLSFLKRMLLSPGVRKIARGVDKVSMRMLKLDSTAWGGLNVEHLLYDYTQKSLSRPTDRLVAVGGLAKVIASRTGQELTTHCPGQSLRRTHQSERATHTHSHWRERASASVLRASETTRSTVQDNAVFITCLNGDGDEL